MANEKGIEFSGIKVYLGNVDPGMLMYMCAHVCACVFVYTFSEQVPKGE